MNLNQYLPHLLSHQSGITILMERMRGRMKCPLSIIQHLLKGLGYRGVFYLRISLLTVKSKLQL